MGGQGEKGQAIRYTANRGVYAPWGKPSIGCACIAFRRLDRGSPGFPFRPATSLAQQPPPSGQARGPAPPQPDAQQQGGMSGIAGGVAAPAQYDEQKRPITAGGFVDSGPIVFQDITKQAGLSGWIHKMGVPQKEFIVETNGSGVCLIDYDNDGWLDIYLVNGSTFDALDGKEEPPARRAVPQQPRRHIYDVSAESGRGQRPLGIRLLGGRLRQRRLARHLRRQLRQEPPLPQQPRRHIYRRGRRGRRRRWATGRRARPGATTTATACSISTSPATSTSTATTCPSPAPRRSDSPIASIAASP